METESRWVVARSWGRQQKVSDKQYDRVSSEGAIIVLKPDSGYGCTTLWKHTHKSLNVCFRWVNCMLCELDINLKREIEENSQNSKKTPKS